VRAVSFGEGILYLVLIRAVAKKRIYTTTTIIYSREVPEIGCQVGVSWGFHVLMKTTTCFLTWWLFSGRCLLEVQKGHFPKNYEAPNSAHHHHHHHHHHHPLFLIFSNIIHYLRSYLLIVNMAHGATHSYRALHETWNRQTKNFVQNGFIYHVLSSSFYRTLFQIYFMLFLSIKMVSFPSSDSLVILKSSVWSWKFKCAPNATPFSPKRKGLFLRSFLLRMIVVTFSPLIAGLLFLGGLNVALGGVGFLAP